ncbi:TP53-binding protein 1 isoform X4 [Gouania willdenowi]|uniref:TP53-binding protein 1 isoform X4 n=1 Tax=Gouania willdenowi TaxID=441366 RepID=UPI001055CD1A|nr:TP53-binding protein 1 isoform X4 [Gouania willdenowi]
MDPGGSELDSSLPQPENPCLIVEDSQPDSMALEDDPESSYRAVLARRLSGLQPAARSPVLELISSPSGSQSSQSQNNNNNNNKAGPGFPASVDASGLQESQSQIISVCSPSNGRKIPSAMNSEMDSGADSTTHCVQTDGGSSQFGFLELSQSQDVVGEDQNSLRMNSDLQSKNESYCKPAEQQKISDRPSEDPRAVSSSSESRSANPRLSVQALLHSQNLQEPECDLLSSQDDMFDANKSSTAVDSTVSEAEQLGPPTPTPARTLGLLHLSGQGTLVQESLSQSSADFVAPTPESYSHTPLIVPSSPTAPENGADEPMDTSPHPQSDAPTKFHLSSSAPVTHNASAVVVGRSLSVPSQPELSHDAFVPTPSLEPQQKSENKSTSQLMDSSVFTPLQLSVNTQSCSTAGVQEDDSQATQIEEEPEEPKPSNGDSAEIKPSDPPQVDRLKPDTSLKEAGSNCCVPETPSTLPSQSVVSTSPAVAVVTGSSGLKGGGGGGRSQEAEPPGASGLALVLTQEEEDSVSMVTDATPQPIRSKATNGHRSLPLGMEVSDRLSQTEGAGPEAKEKSLSDSSGEISFHFTLPKDGELIGPAVGSSPPSIHRLKQTMRHSTPIETASFSKTPESAADVSADVALAGGDSACGASSEASDGGDGKLSLRMKLVTPVEEGSSDRFSLQKPQLSEEGAAVVREMTASKAVTSPSVFTRVRQVHRRQQEAEDNATIVRSELFSSPQTCSQTSSLGCRSLPNSQSEAPQQDQAAEPKHTALSPQGRREQGAESQQATPTKRATPHQNSTDPSMLRSPAERAEAESPPIRRAAAPSHRRHVRTVQEVRTTVTRTITDVYYEDGKEVDRRVTEESEEPTVDCQVFDSDISPCRTGSSLTSGDLADISSLSSKASGTSSRPDFVMPPGRGARTNSPRRGGGPRHRGQRGHRGERASPGHAPLGSSSLVPPSPRGRARRGRPPSRGGGVSLQRPAPLGSLSSSEDEPIGRMLPPPVPVSPSEPEPLTHSDSLRSSPEDDGAPRAPGPSGGGGSSFVGLRVVAKWSSNGYFYSGRIISDADEGRFRLRFDDGYECEVAGRDVLLCDPIPLDTEVTALLEDQFFSVGVVKGHKSEGQDLFYSVERDGQRQWHNRTAVILSLDQGNRLREQHSLGPYEPTTPLTKPSDISLDNLVEGKRRRTGTPTRSSSSPQTPGPSSGKRKLTASKEGRTPAKRGRRGAGTKAAQRVGECNTSGSGTDLAIPSVEGGSQSHGPLPQNASLFMGFVFMLTASSERDRLTNRLTSDDEEDYVETGPYNKKYTESQLEAGGGFILPDFNEEQCKAAYQSLLIADQHCRTRRYLLCVASGVPCVSHIWVQDCCKENKLLNYRNYLLPAGVGPDNDIVEWHPRCSPFKALKVLLVFEEPVQLWAQLLSMGGASSVRQFQAEKDGSDGGHLDLVVSDASCPSALESRMSSQDVPLVSPEWIIQSLICGERLGFHSNPQYRHNYATAAASS